MFVRFDSVLFFVGRYFMFFITVAVYLKYESFILISLYCMEILILIFVSGTSMKSSKIYDSL